MKKLFDKQALTFGIGGIIGSAIAVMVIIPRLPASLTGGTN